MIKRRFYKLEHGERNEASSASSSSDSDSDSEVEAEATEQPGSSPSGYESEDSSVAEEFNADSSDEDDRAGKVREESGLYSADTRVVEPWEKEFEGAANHKPLPSNLPSHILKLKSVYRCRICPKVVCLNEETMRAHINSKKHARSGKLFKENKLREMLNSRGEIENQETAAELHARVVALAQEKPKKKKKRQKMSSTDKKVGDDSNKKRKTGRLKSNPTKRKRKNGS